MFYYTTCNIWKEKECELKLHFMTLLGIVQTLHIETDYLHYNNERYEQ